MHLARRFAHALILVLVPDLLARWMSIEVARVVGWGVAGSLWVVSVEPLWQARFGPVARFLLSNVGEMQRDRRLPFAAVSCAVLCAAIGGLAGRASALHRETPGSVRLTRSTSHFHPAGRMWGNDVAFVSDVDLAFNGNAEQQIFVYNHFQWVCQNGTPVPGTEARCPVPPIPFMQQVTFGPGLPDNPSMSQSKGSCQLDPNIPARRSTHPRARNAGCQAQKPRTRARVPAVWEAQLHRATRTLRISMPRAPGKNW